MTLRGEASTGIGIVALAAALAMACGGREALLGGAPADGTGSIEDGSAGSGDRTEDASAGLDAQVGDARTDGAPTGTEASTDAASEKDGDAGAGDGSTDASLEPCTPSCGGCCAGGFCIPFGPQPNETCGLGGGACEVCPAGSTCRKGACIRPQPNCGTSNCEGCCSDANTCTTGLASDACGSGGNQCQGCLGWMHHETVCIPLPSGGGVCSPPCSPANCNGCCNGYTCLLGQTNDACGAGGVACAACPAGETCRFSGGVGGSCAP